MTFLKNFEQKSGLKFKVDYNSKKNIFEVRQLNSGIILNTLLNIPIWAVFDHFSQNLDRSGKIEVYGLVQEPKKQLKSMVNQQ
jgi:hypothetical protein